MAVVRTRVWPDRSVGLPAGRGSGGSLRRGRSSFTLASPITKAGPSRGRAGVPMQVIAKDAITAAAQEDEAAVLAARTLEEYGLAFGLDTVGNAPKIAHLRVSRPAHRFRAMPASRRTGRYRPRGACVDGHQDLRICSVTITKSTPWPSLRVIGLARLRAARPAPNAGFVCGGCGDRSVVCVRILQSWRAPPGLQAGANAAELIPVGACRAVFAGAVLAAALR
jgi:hypothetical protein